jgi:hypothetical protein
VLLVDAAGELANNGAARASIVLDAHVYRCVDQIGREVHRLLCVHEHVLVIFGVVRRPRRDFEHVLLRVCNFRHPGWLLAIYVISIVALEVLAEMTGLTGLSSV